jgi:hypothetical protein
MPLMRRFDYGNSVYVFLCVGPLLFLETGTAYLGCWVARSPRGNYKKTHQ